MQQTRLSRTERVARIQKFERLKQQEAVLRQKQELEKQKRLEAIETISTADYENYQEIYDTIDPEYREGITTPTELKETSGYKDYQDQKIKNVEVSRWTRYFDAYSNRNKPFVLGLNPDQEEIRKFNEVKKAMAGKPSDVPSHVLNTLRGGVRTDFSSSPRVYGMDIGETRTITTRDQATGEIKKQEVFKKVIDPETKKPVLMFGKVTGEEIKEMELKALQVARDDAYSEWQQDQKGKPQDLPFKIIPAKDLPLGYGGQQSISTEPKNLLLTEEQFYLRDDTKKFDFGIGKVWSGVKTGYKWVDDRVHLDFALSGSPSMPKTQIITFGLKEDPTIAEKFIDKGIEGLGKTAQDVEDWAVGKDRIEDFKLDLETKYSDKFQQSFETKYMKQIIYEEKTFEEASSEFVESKEAKILQKKYEEEYQTGYKELQTDVPFWKGTAGGIAQTGISLGSLGLKTIRSPTRTIVTAGGIYAGVGVLKAIPTAVSLTASGGLFAYGTYKFVSPTSTYIQRGGGLITAVLSGATLGYAGYKYLKSPVVKTVKIKSPKMDLKSTEVIGKDLKIITKGGTKNLVKFDAQKLSQTGTAGRRTIVTTKGRVLFNKYTGIKLKNIYEGIPTQQLGKAYYVQSLRGSYVVRGQSAYQKSLKLLQKYGYTSSQAKATLRYYAPRVTEQYLDRGLIITKGDKAIGRFDYLTKRPVIDVDKSLGIKTRGGSTIKDIYRVERKLIDFKGKSVVLEQKTHLSLSLDKAGRIKDFKALDFSKGLNIGKATDLKKGYEFLGKDQFGSLYKPVQYRDLYGVSISRKILPSDKFLRIDTSRTKLINEIMDLTKTKPFKVTKIKKTPFSKTFDVGDDLVDQIIGKQKPMGNVNKIIDKIDDIAIKGSGSQQFKQSEFYGKGVYERTDVMGGISPTQTQTQLQLQQQLKAITLPDQIKVGVNLKDLIKVKQFDVMAGLEVGQLSALKVATGLKTDLKFKSDLKTDLQLKNLLKEDVKIKMKFKEATLLKTNQTLKMQLKTINDLSLTTPTFSTTIKSPSMPQIPKIKPPIPIPLVFPQLKREILKKTKKSKGIWEKAYLPDFTSRALGLKPESVNVKNLMKKINKIQTGLEVRRGVVIK